MAHTRCKVPLTPILLLWWNTLLLLPANVMITLSFFCPCHARWPARVKPCLCTLREWQQQFQGAANMQILMALVLLSAT